MSQLAADGHGVPIASAAAMASGAMLEGAMASADIASGAMLEGAMASVDIASEVAMASGAIAPDGAMASPDAIASGAMLDGAIASVDMASTAGGGHEVDDIASSAKAEPASDIKSAALAARIIELVFIERPSGFS